MVGKVGGGATLAQALDERGLEAVYRFVARVLDEVPARLVQAALFGSVARGEARSTSDVDVLLVFCRLPPDREPHAGHAERIAAEVARETGVPVTVWSVSFADLRVGGRTPMLVDALTDSIPIWFWPEPIPPLDFTPADAQYCATALLQRVEEGSAEYQARLRRGEQEEAAARARDDIVRVCTALVLTSGHTRPRRGAVVRAAALLLGDLRRADPEVEMVLEWAAASFGPEGRDEESLVPSPPLHPPALAAVVDRLRDEASAATASVVEQKFSAIQEPTHHVRRRCASLE